MLQYVIYYIHMFSYMHTCVCAKLLQLCLTLCDPMNCSPPDSSVHWILQAIILEWKPFPSPEDLPNPGVNSGSPALQADFLLSEPPRKPSK